MLFPNYIETDRLVLEPIHTKLTPKELYEYCGSTDIEDVTENTHWNKHESILKSIQVLSNMKQDWENGNAMHFHITFKETDEFAGLCSLDIDFEKKQGELGIWLRKKYWGKKISRERAFCLMDTGFTELDLSSIIIVVNDVNKKSKKAVSEYISKVNGQKCGVVTDRHVMTDGTVNDASIFTVTKEQFISSPTTSKLQKITWNTD